MADVWALRIAAIIAASATIYFVALAIITGPAHGPFIPVVVAGLGLSVALLIGSRTSAEASVLAEGSGGQAWVMMLPFTWARAGWRATGGRPDP